MGAEHLQCHCGQLVFVPAEKAAGGIRCPACGATVRAGGARPTRHADAQASRPADSSRTPEQAASDENDSDAAGEYVIASAPNEPTSPRHAAGQGTFHRSAGGSLPGGTWTGPGSPRTFAETALLEERVRARPAVTLPGPFFKLSALFYPWLHPTWIQWLGLSFMTWLAVGMVSGSWFVFRVIMQFHAFVSLFTVPVMAMGCLALVSFVCACFVAVIEVTAEGEDRLSRLAELNWWESLPRFMRTFGAAIITATATFGVTYPLRRWLLPGSIELSVVRAIVALQLFPILLITNLVDGSWVPFTSLPTTIKRLAACVGSFAVFLVLTVPISIGVCLLIAWLEGVHAAAALAAVGPVGAAWLMFYGHWLGRLVRQLAAD